MPRERVVFCPTVGCGAGRITASRSRWLMCEFCLNSYRNPLRRWWRW